jgi:hypothetical protein
MEGGVGRRGDNKPWMNNLGRASNVRLKHVLASSYIVYLLCSMEAFLLGIFPVPLCCPGIRSVGVSLDALGRSSNAFLLLLFFDIHLHTFLFAIAQRSAPELALGDCRCTGKGLNECRSRVCCSAAPLIARRQQRQQQQNRIIPLHRITGVRECVLSSAQ